MTSPWRHHDAINNAIPKHPKHPKHPKPPKHPKHPKRHCPPKTPKTPLPTKTSKTSKRPKTNSQRDMTGRRRWPGKATTAGGELKGQSLWRQRGEGEHVGGGKRRRPPRVWGRGSTHAAAHRRPRRCDAAVALTGQIATCGRGGPSVASVGQIADQNGFGRCADRSEIACGVYIRGIRTDGPVVSCLCWAVSPLGCDVFFKWR